jgi:site-specific DNA-methyltransferase (adenine-specific)
MLERLIALATNPSDIVLDPFAGTGTTFYAAEVLKRRWLGVELGEVEPAIQRLTDHARGEHPRWEGARGLTRINGKNVHGQRIRNGTEQAQLDFEVTK